MSVVRANVRGRDMVGFVEAARQKVAAELPLPQGYRLTWGGQFENQQRAAARLSVVVPVAIGLIFVLLFTTFGSIRQALLVLVNIPFALIGGVFALGPDRRVPLRPSVGRVHRAARHRGAQRRRAGLLFQSAPRPRRAGGRMSWRAPSAGFDPY